MRRIAREDVFKLVFEFTFYNVANECTRELLMLDDGLDDDDKLYIKDTYFGIINRIEELRGVISKNLSGYGIDRLYRPDYVALLVATYELLEKTAPNAVIINEAVALSKKYGTDKSGAFVNGVLAKIAQSIA